MLVAKMAYVMSSESSPTVTENAWVEYESCCQRVGVIFYFGVLVISAWAFVFIWCRYISW